MALTPEPMLLNYHEQLTRRSLAYHRLVAERVRRDPSLLKVASINLLRWRAASGTRAPSYLAEWETILAQGLDYALMVATRDNDESDRLRQSTPFAGVLSPKERWEFLRSWKDGSLNI